MKVLGKQDSKNIHRNQRKDKEIKVQIEELKNIHRNQRKDRDEISKKDQVLKEKTEK